jgi:hypothetical protein
VRPASGAPKLKPFDLSKASGEELLGYLSHPNEWFRKQAVLEIGWRGMKDWKTLFEASAQTDSHHALECPVGADGCSWMKRNIDQSKLFFGSGRYDDQDLRRWAVKMMARRQE